MKTVTTSQWLRAIFLVSITLISATVALEAAVSARLDPDQIPLGRATRLAVTVSDSQSGTVEIPDVPDLLIRQSGQRSQIQIINGTMSKNIMYTYTVEPTKTGEFTIPAITVTIDGKKHQTEPLTLHVTKGAPPLTAQPPMTGHPPTGSGPSSPVLAPDKLAFLRIELPDRKRADLYVGELVPVKVRAYFREGVQVSLTSTPQINGGAFTLSNFSDEPEQTVTRLNGVPYRVITWQAGLSGVKEGAFPIDATLEAKVGVPAKRQRARRSSPFGRSMFDDPFFDSFFDDFFARVEQRDVTLTTDKRTLEVRSLPSEGRPENFAGAVGQFKLGGFSIPATANVGDPVSIKVAIDGRGNFDRVTTPEIEPADRWRTYNADSQYKRQDESGWSGTKTFEIPAIPSEPGVQDIQLNFSFFDPEAAEYKTIATETLPIEISGERRAVTLNPKEQPDPVATETTDTSGKPTENATVAFAPLRDELGDIRQSYRPWYLRTSFAVLNGGLALALFMGLGFQLYRRQQREHPEWAAFRETDRAVKESLERLGRHLKDGDVSGFFAQARRAIQLRLAQAWDCKADTITALEVAEREESYEEAIRILEMADAVSFSGATIAPKDLEKWSRCLGDALETISRNERAPSSDWIQNAC